MGLAGRLVKSFLLWLLIMIILILIILFPRTITFGGDIANIDRNYEFNWVEYKSNIVHFFTSVWENKSLGQSRVNITVEEELARYVPRSLALVIPAFFLSILLGVLKGIYDYKTMRKKKSIIGNGTTWFFQSMPDFLVVMGVQYFFILLMRMTPFKMTIYDFSTWYEMILPILLLSIFPTTYIARVTLSSLAGQEGMMYLLTAKGKGLSDTLILFKHTLKNCWGNILSHTSSIMLFLLSNLLIVEYLMFYKGAAYRLYEALGYAQRRMVYTYRHQTSFEPEVVIGFILVFMMLVLIAQLISQIARYYLDPR